MDIQFYNDNSQRLTTKLTTTTTSTTTTTTTTKIGKKRENKKKIQQIYKKYRLLSRAIESQKQNFLNNFQKI